VRKVKAVACQRMPRVSGCKLAKPSPDSVLQEPWATIQGGAGEFPGRKLCIENTTEAREDRGFDACTNVAVRRGVTSLSTLVKGRLRNRSL
jgi:hypothetical protein